MAGRVNQLNTGAEPDHTEIERKRVNTMRALKTVQVIATAVLGLVTVAGCTSSGSSAKSSSASPAESSSSTKSSGGASSSASKSPPANTSSAKASSPAANPTSKQSNPPICAAVNLGFTLDPSNGAAGSTIQPILLSNKGSETCTLAGFPGVSFVAGDDGHQVGKAADKDTTKAAQTVTLSPGSNAQFVLKIVHAENYPTATCQPVQARGLRIYTPGETHAAFLPLDVQACASDAEALLITGPVTPG